MNEIFLLSSAFLFFYLLGMLVGWLIWGGND